MTSAALPVELWDEIIKTLPKSAQNICLSVCRSWRRVCLRSLFSVIRLSMELDDGANDQEEIDMVSRAWELLDRIAHDAVFARVVKTIIVLSWDYGHCIFQTRSLEKALRAVPHLHSFQWFPEIEIPASIVNTLGHHVPKLSDIRTSVCFPITAHGLRQLRSLSCLAHPDTPADQWGEEYHIMKLIAANVDTLRELALDSSNARPWHLPMRTFENLSHLSLIALVDLDGLDLVLRHSPNLQSFIVDAEDDELFPILQHNASTVPLLNSLKIISKLPNHSEAQYLALATFIQGRLGLRRLDIHMESPLEDALAIMPTIMGLKALTAFGLSIYEGVTETGDYSLLPSFLSDTLEAVRFQVALEEPVLDRGPLLPLMDRLGQLPSLRYLSLQKDGPGDLWPLAAEVGSNLRHLTCLSLDQSLWFIERSSPPDEPMSAWLPHKSILRLREDFEYQDAEWLARFVI